MNIDELLAAVASELRAINIHVALETAASDRDRAFALYWAGTSVLVKGRALFLRCAATFLGLAFEARAGDDHAEAERWAARAEAEIERYLEPSPELPPYFVGGAS